MVEAVPPWEASRDRRRGEARQRSRVDLKGSRVWTGSQGLDSEKCRERR